MTPLASDQQQRIIEFLSGATSYKPPVDRVEIIETHITRRRACEAELALNRRTAPALYLEVRSISEDAGGTIGWGEVRRNGAGLAYVDG